MLTHLFTADTLVADGLKVFGLLNLLTAEVLPQDQTLQFSFDIATLKNAKNLDFSSLLGSNQQMQGWQQGGWGSQSGSSFNWQSSGLYLQYINQQNLPIGVPLENPSLSGTTVTFNANFPFTENELNSLTIAAVTVGTNFTDANDVAAHTLFGPALIEVN